MIWLKFAVNAAFIVIFCISLSKYADQLAAAKKVGKGFVGFVLLGVVTSIPELISTVSCTAFLDNPIMGTANIMGSNNANMFILFLALLGVKSLRRPSGNIDVESCVSLGYCMIITTIFLMGIFFSGAPFYGKSIFVYLIALVFILSIRSLYNSNDEGDEDTGERESLGWFFYCKFVFFAVGLVISSFTLSIVVDELGRETNIGSAAAGAIFLAWATSLPELVVTITSIICGSVEMGIGNILGSNIFNLFILVFAETVSRSSVSVFSRQDEMMILGVFNAVLQGILLILLMQKKLRRIGRVPVMPLVSMLIYIAGMAFLI